MPKREKVRGWSKKDVSRWLEKRGLVKFVPLFLKNGVVGSDLVESKLGFLYDEEVMVEDREQILAEIYMLLHPDSPRLTRKQTPSPALRRPLSAKDRAKYEAALQVARSSSAVSSTAAMLVIGPRSRSPAAFSGATLTLPGTKQRSRSESGLDTGVSDRSVPPSPIRKYLKRKSTPAVHDYLQRGVLHGMSLYETLHNQDRVCFHCVQVHRTSTQAKFGFAFQTLPDNCLIVTNIQSSDSPLQPGDRIVEVNGMILPHQSRGSHKGGSLDTVLAKAASLDLVIVRPLRGSDTGSARPTSGNAQLHNEAVMAEVRWQSLRETLVALQNKAFDPLQVKANTPLEDMEDMKSRTTLEMEVDQLQKSAKEHEEKIRNLETTLRSKTQELEEMRRQRDMALQKLRAGVFQSAQNSGTQNDSQLPKGDKRADFHAQFYEEYLKSLESPDKTKEDVLCVVRELIRASRQQTSYLDRLTSVVLTRAPWMLDEIEAEDDESDLPSCISHTHNEGCPSPSSSLRTPSEESSSLSSVVQGDDDFGQVILV